MQSDENDDRASEDSPQGTELDVDAISPAALRGLVEEFVTRDGTDYGSVERSVETKIEDVLRQLRNREARIVFDAESETANIVMTRELPQS